MGNSFGGFEDIFAAKKDGTTLVDLRIKKLRDAPSIAGLRPKNFTPVVLSPESAMEGIGCCPCCYTSIPSGFSAIVTKFGAVVDGDQEDQTWSPGCHCFYPFYTVDKLVSQQLITFDTPVKDCKTANFITVNIDVMIQFKIVKAKQFVYSIGADKFDDLLRASQDEVLRMISNETQLAEIFDLCGRDFTDVVEEFTKKFEPYGVEVVNFTVKNVRIPDDMAQDAEDKTLFDSKTTRDHMKQKFDRQRVQIDEAKNKLKEECDNARMAAEQQAEVVKNQAMKVTSEVVSRTSRDIQELEANRDLEQKKLLTEAELEVSKQKAQIMALEREMNSRTEAECAKIIAEAEAFSKQTQTDARIEAAQKLANGKQAIGIAEGAASEAFALRRAFESELRRLMILEQVTRKHDMKIATSQENTVSMNSDNLAVTQAVQQGVEAVRAKLAEITSKSLLSIESSPSQLKMG